MRVSRSKLVRFGCAVVVGAAALAASWSGGSDVTAQCKGGEFALGQIAPVGWVYVTPDRTAEWWAYIDGQYRWADQSSVGENKWRLEAEYLGAPVYPSYGAWKASVRQRAAAQGRTIVFQRHEVAEEVVQN